MKGFTTMYQFSSRVRYSETGEDGCLSLTGVINYFQDCSTFHSEDCHMGIAYLKEQRKSWMLSSLQLEICRYPELGEEITVGTWHCGRKGIYGYRNFILLDQKNQPLAKADSTWFLLNLDNGMPCRVRAEDVKGYGIPGEPLPMEKNPGSFPGKRYILGIIYMMVRVNVISVHRDFLTADTSSQKVDFSRILFHRQITAGRPFWGM